MKSFFSLPFSFLLDLVIKVLEPLTKRTKHTWDDIIVRILKLIRLALKFGGLKK